MGKTKNYITLGLTSIIASSALAINNEPQSKNPNLVVGIIINGLDYDKIELLRDNFGPNGFNRLLANGVVLPQIEFGNVMDATAATGIIYTGASPSINGITNEYVFDRTERRPNKTLNDPSVLGNFTDETLSPSAILTTTLSDEFKIGNGDLGRVYALSPNASQSIILAGHAGNSACWITDNTGRWATSTFYKDMPQTVQSFNHVRPLSSRIDTMAWRPSIPLSNFSSLPSYKKLYPFTVTFNKSAANRYKAFKSSALANEEVTNLAGNIIETMKLGTHDVPEMINITFTAEPYLYASDFDNRPQLYDTYIKIDRQLEKLFSIIDKSGPGLKNTLIFVAGTPEPSSTLRDDEKFKISTGEFSPSRAVSLLNMNLMSIYGNGDYVSGYNERQFFLNTKFIKDRGLDIKKIRHEAADFIQQMSGISQAVTLDDVMSEIKDYSNDIPLSRNIKADRAGDIFISITPGWSISDTNSLNYTNQLVERLSPSVSCAFILHPSIKPQTITNPVDAREIAPTITRLLRIRSPNGAQMPGIRLR